MQEARKRRDRGIQGGLSISLQVHITSASKAIGYSLNTNCTDRPLQYINVHCACPVFCSWQGAIHYTCVKVGIVQCKNTLLQERPPFKIVHTQVLKAKCTHSIKSTHYKEY